MLDLFPSGEDRIGKAVQPGYKEAIIVCMTARVGSNAILSGLDSLGIAQADRNNLAKGIEEIFNSRRRVVRGLVKTYSAGNLQEYFNAIPQETLLGDQLVFKTNFWDFQFILREQLLAQVFPNVRFIYIERMDKLAQAVSLLRASKTQLFHVEQGDEEKTMANDDSAYSDWEIMKHFRTLVGEDNRWKRFFLRQGIRPHFIDYENFDKAPRKVVADTYQFITGKEVSQDEINIRLKKTGDKRSKELIDGIKKRLEA